MDTIDRYETPISRTREKWGPAIDQGLTGFQVVPDMLLRNQTNLGLSATDIVVLLNILMHWWTREKLPRPNLSSIARRMGVTRRTVERSVEKMEQLRLLERRAASGDPNARGGKQIDPEGLVTRLQERAESMRQYEERYFDENSAV